MDRPDHAICQALFGNQEISDVAVAGASVEPPPEVPSKAEFERQLLAAQPELANFVRYLGVHGEIARDLIQDVNLNALRFRDQFYGDHIMPWLKMIARRLLPVVKGLIRITEKGKSRWVPPPHGGLSIDQLTNAGPDTESGPSHWFLRVFGVAPTQIDQIYLREVVREILDSGDQKSESRGQRSKLSPAQRRALLEVLSQWTVFAMTEEDPAADQTDIIYRSNLKGARDKVGAWAERCVGCRTSPAASSAANESKRAGAR